MITTRPTDRSSRRMQAKSMRRAVLPRRVVMSPPNKVRTREAARAGSCLLRARPSPACSTCCVQHARLARARRHPHPLKGLWRAHQHNAKTIMRSTRPCAGRLNRPHNLRYVECPRLHPCNHSVAAHPCASYVFNPRPPGVLRAFAPNTPLPPRGLPFSRCRSTRCTLSCRSHCALPCAAPAKNGVRGWP